MTELAINTHDLRITFGGGRHPQVKALDGVNFQLERGENYCLLGPNGAGKTTLIRSVLGLLDVDAGTAEVLGFEMPKQRDQIISRVGYMPQDVALYPDLSVNESMHFFGRIYGISHKKERTKKIDELQDFFLLKRWKKSRVDNLSGGMKRRLSLACTLIHEPDLLILDEPTVGVDPNLRQTFWEYFKDLNHKGITILTTTHIMDEAEKSRIIGFMRAGKMIAQGTAHELKKNVPTSRKLIIETAMQDTDHLAEIIRKEYDLKVLSRDYHIEALYEEGELLDNLINLVRNKTQITSVQTVEPSLEDTFIFFSQDNNQEGLKK